MRGPGFDAEERVALCDLLEQVGPDASTLLEGWTTHDLAAHIVLRERDLVAGPSIALPGPFQRFAERRRVRLKQRREYPWLVDRIRSGPPPGFFRLRWVRSYPNLNEFFVHHEDVRRAQGREPRELSPELEAALWRNVRRGSRFLSRRLGAVGLELRWAETDDRILAHAGEPVVEVAGSPGELLLFAFGRDAARVGLTGPAEAVVAVEGNHFGM